MSFTDLLFYLSGGTGPGPGSSVSLAAAVSGPQALGPIASTPDEEIPAVGVRVLDRANPYAEGTLLDQSFGRTWQDQISEPGSGTVSLDNRDVDLALIEDESLLRFELNGQAQMLVLPKSRTQVTVAPGEEHDEITTLTGPGHLAVLSEAVVYPSRGVGSLPIEDDRLFSWPAPDFDDSGWVDATEIARQDATSEWWTNLPNQPFWPDPLSFWIWAHQGSELSAPPGTCYFRRTFTLADPARVVIFFTVDDIGSVYIDGQHLTDLDVGSRADTAGPTEVRYLYLILSAGDHVLAVEATNSPGAPGDDPAVTNPAGFLLSMFAMAGNTLGDLLIRTDDNWVMVEYPASPPGMTPGRVVEILAAEAVDRGSLPALLFLMFDDQVDSNGNPWPVVGDISTKVGTDYLTFLRQMSGTYFDMWMAPSGFELYLFSLDQQGVDTSIDWHPPTDADDPTSGNVDQLVHLRAT